ncbi:MAG TPA: hypothetical protein VJ208_02990 [Candidatus Nanoarchaeia archaeon]|nr:hypothetical protein [Candidatus Nanoarchaeia archaeon]
MKKCIYCKNSILAESVIDFCEPCGVGVWGKKMFDTIRSNMEEASETGNLVSTNMNPNFEENEGKKTYF